MMLVVPTYAQWTLANVSKSVLSMEPSMKTLRFIVPATGEKTLLGKFITKIRGGKGGGPSERIHP